MNRKFLYSGTLICKIVLASVFILMTAVSCLKSPDKTHYRNLIPEKDFISILTELHLTNGLFAIPEFRTQHMINDTSQLYVEIIESYGYTTQAMDTTIQYYYIKKPKKLIQIYDQILGKFSELETRVEKQFLGSAEFVADQWNGPAIVFLPDPGGKEKADFELTFISPGTYSLTYTVTIYPGDQSYDPCFSAWLCNTDSIRTGKKNYLPSIRYIKDGKPHTYTVTGTYPDIARAVFKGRLCDYGSNPDAGEQNAVIENISFFYSGTVK
jgi:hypothetical protein